MLSFSSLVQLMGKSFFVLYSIPDVTVSYHVYFFSISVLFHMFHHVRFEVSFCGSAESARFASKWPFSCMDS